MLGRAAPSLLNCVRFLLREIARRRRAIFAQPNANDEKQPPDISCRLEAERKPKTVDYVIVLLALAMVGLYALLIHWLLPKT